jgi:hypothetical protein
VEVGGFHRVSPGLVAVGPVLGTPLVVAAHSWLFHERTVPMREQHDPCQSLRFGDILMKIVIFVGFTPPSLAAAVETMTKSGKKLAAILLKLPQNKSGISKNFHIFPYVAAQESARRHPC